MPVGRRTAVAGHVVGVVRRVEQSSGRPHDRRLSLDKQFKRLTVDLVRFAVDTECTLAPRVAFSHNNGDAHLSPSIERWLS